jgi:hypothetical protein
MSSRIAKTIVFSLTTLFVAALPLQAQVPSPLELNLATTGGELLSVNPGKLTLVNAWLTAVSVNGGPPIVTGSVGAVTFTTPQFSSGTLATGGAFNAGGGFFISSEWDFCIAATFVHGTWKRLGYSDGTANYVLVAEIEGTMCYLGVTYPMHGRTVEIAGEVSGDFLGTHSAGGGSTSAGVH